MTTNRKPTGTALSIPAGIAWGLLWALGMTLAGTCIAAKLIDKEIMAWKDSGYAVLVILLLSAWMGSSVSINKIKHRKLMVGMLCGICYFGALLLTTALFFGGQFSGIGETALLILCGSVLGYLSAYRAKTRRKHRKTGYHNR